MGCMKLMMQAVLRKAESVRRLYDVHASRGGLVRVSLRFDSAASAGHLFIFRESSMSHASKSLPVFKKLAVLLRNIPAVQFVFGKFSTLLRTRKMSAEAPFNKFLGGAAGPNNQTAYRHSAIL